jgi:hypothetical protein
MAQCSMDEKKDLILYKKVKEIYSEKLQYLRNFFNLIFTLITAQQMQILEIPYANVVELEVKPIISSENTIEKSKSILPTLDLSQNIDTLLLSEKVKTCERNLLLTLDLSQNIDTLLLPEKVKTRNLNLSCKNRTKNLKKKTNINQFINILLNEYKKLKSKCCKFKTKWKKKYKFIERPEVFWKEIIKWMKIGKIKKLIKWKERFKENISKEICNQKPEDWWGIAALITSHRASCLLRLQEDKQASKVDIVVRDFFDMRGRVPYIAR